MNKHPDICRIGIADDHKLIIEGIKAMLEGENYEFVFSTQKLMDLDELLGLYKVDILLLDINFNGKSSLDRIERYKHLYPKLKIVICTSYDSGVFVDDALKKGASGYVLKDITKPELLEVLNEVQLGKKKVHNRINYKNQKSLSTLKDVFLKYSTLTKREKEITAELFELKTTEQIANLLHISHNTVHTHRKNIFKKLSIHSTSDLIKQYHQLGEAY